MSKEIELLKEKIDQFDKNIKEYKSKIYDEYNTRADFIDIFFSALGWDMYNTKGVIEQFREVVREDKVIIQGKKKAPDYAFKIGPQVVFYVEAKKPSIDIKNDPEPAFQLRRYAHTQGLNLSILTDFEEIAVYDTRVKPKNSDSAAVARVFYCTYDQLFKECSNKEFDTNFTFLYNTFGKDAVLNGSFNRYANENKHKKGTGSVDKGFLSLINDWREKLATNIALKNDEIDEYNLNIAVQKIIDRLVFLRIAEDRLIEDNNYLRNTIEAKYIYSELLKIFDDANEKYNSGLFDTEDWLRNIIIDNKILIEIINEMYFPNCPYEFSVLPIEILGNAYEQFLGKTIKYIRKTKYGHKIEIEEKPEVRKAGGVFYTPDYIVDYIVERTVGRKIKDLSPEKITGVDILDPACGSGSFLIGAYDYLIRYHLQWYLGNEKRKSKAIKNGDLYQASKNKYKLSTSKKSEILVNCIFGVDIDPQAVEVTKLSLLLKVLEDENLEYKEELFKAQHHHLLPDLSNNIKCGNSLIESDFYRDKDLSLFGISEMRKVNTFNWNDEFNHIFQHKKFDCVIGNPPYFNVETLGVGSKEIQYIKENFKSWMDKSDILFYFIEKAINLSDCYTGFIISNAFLYAAKAQKLRNYILSNSNIEEIINFEQFQVFDDASITTALLFLNNESNNQTNAISLPNKYYERTELLNLISKKENFINVKFAENSIFSINETEIQELNDKIDIDCSNLNSIFHVGSGMQTGANNVFIFDKIPSDFPDDFFKFRVSGNNISRYIIEESKKYILYIEDFENFEDLPESIKNYLKENEDILRNRADKKRRQTSKWWNFTFPMHKEYYKLPKIWTSYRSRSNIFAYDNSNDYIGLTNTTVIFGNNQDISMKYLLALLNSQLLNFRYLSIGKQTGGGIYEYFENGVGKLPIRVIDKEEQEPLIKQVESMLSTLKERYTTQSDKTMWKMKIDQIQKRIDSMVFELYEISEEERILIKNELVRNGIM